MSATGSSDSSGNWLTKFAQYTYLADRKLDLEDNPGNGMHTKFTYDGRGFVNQINTYRASSSQPYTKRDYYRDSRDRIYAWKKGSYNAINPMENSRGDRYTYDNEGQLTAASYQATTPDGTPGTPERTDSFIYDQLGNRKSPPNNQIASLGSVTFHRRDNGLNQYQDWTQWAINYEANGNLYQDGWLTASFNALNQTTGIWSWRVTPTGDAVNSAYDPLGRCVKRWSGMPSVISYLYYDGWSLIQEGPNAATADRIYAHGNRIDEIVSSQAGGVWAYHHYDARGHCIMLTDASGNILEQYDYDAFGKPYFYNASGALQTSSGWGNKFLFTGREWLKQVAVYDFRNRHYLPELGRFIQPDPEQFAAGDYNLYRYCHNDPVNKTDPMGLEFFPYEGAPTPVDTLNNGAGLGETQIAYPKVIPVLQSDGTTTLRLEVHVRNILVAQRVKFHGQIKARSTEEKNVTFEEHEKREHGKDWRRFHDEKQSEVPTTRYKDPNAAQEAAKSLQEKFKSDAWKAKREFEKHEPNERWKNIRDRELPH